MINTFQLCSGLKLKYTKTEILPIGEHLNLDTLPVKVVTSACSLGIKYSDNINNIIEDNYTSKVSEIEKALTNWKKRKLTLLGKSTVIKTLIVPKINHVISNITTPEWFVVKIQDMILNFIWDGKPPKIKNSPQNWGGGGRGERKKERKKKKT